MTAEPVPPLPVGAGSRAEGHPTSRVGAGDELHRVSRWEAALRLCKGRPGASATLAPDPRAEQRSQKCGAGAHHHGSRTSWGSAGPSSTLRLGKKAYFCRIISGFPRDLARALSGKLPHPRPNRLRSRLTLSRNLEIIRKKYGFFPNRPVRQGLALPRVG